MKLFSLKTVTVDFEKLGYQTMLQCRNEERAKVICAQEIHSYAVQLQPKIEKARAEIADKRHRSAALHEILYDRPIPVNAAAMLTHRQKCRVLAALALVAANASLASNAITFSLFGFGWTLTLAATVAMTVLPVVVGHLAFEKIVARHYVLQVLVIVAAVVLCALGFYRYGDARRIAVDKAVATTAANSYVDSAPDDNATEPDPSPKDDSESKAHKTLGGAFFLIMIAVDISLGLIVGLLAQKLSDENYAAWIKLNKLAKQIIELEEKVAKWLVSIEIAKRQCMAGILRAAEIVNKRRTPYHPALTMLIVAAVAIYGSQRAQAETVEHYEGILIDTSGSISKGGTTNDLFHEYLVATKKVLLTEPANSRIWVSSISTDSFGGAQEVVKGWTPASRGVFTDNLNRARRQLASSFEAKSAELAPVASGTDIFGGLWHLKALFESSPQTNGSQPVSKTIWIFSDMVNEAPAFPMPSLLEMGAEKMVEHAQAKGLLVPLNGYKIYVSGASPSGLTPQAWVTVKNFWTAYFAAAGAELVTYSAECELRR